MSTANSARNRKSASLKVVPANTDQGAPDPAKIANALSSQAYDLSKLFRAIARLNGGEMPCEDGKDEEDWDITLLTEIGMPQGRCLQQVHHSGIRGRRGRSSHSASQVG